MKPDRTKPNYSMYVPPALRVDIDKKIASGEYSSVAAFLIDSAQKNLKK